MVGAPIEQMADSQNIDDLLKSNAAFS